MKLFAKLFSDDKKIKIDFCEKNLNRFVLEENFSDYQEFLSQKKILYKEFDCQSKCKECKKSPYAIVDGQFITADNSNELLDKLKDLYNLK